MRPTEDRAANPIIRHQPMSAEHQFKRSLGLAPLSPVIRTPRFST